MTEESSHPHHMLVLEFHIPNSTYVFWGVTYCTLYFFSSWYRGEFDLIRFVWAAPREPLVDGSEFWYSFYRIKKFSHVSLWIFIQWNIKFQVLVYLIVITHNIILSCKDIYYYYNNRSNISCVHILTSCKLVTNGLPIAVVPWWRIL